jgi:hypothetical protein
MMGEYATVPLDDSLAGFKKDGHEDLEVLRIHRIHKVRGIYDVAAENCELTSLGRHFGAGLVNEFVHFILSS